MPHSTPFGSNTRPRDLEFDHEGFSHFSLVASGALAPPRVWQAFSVFLLNSAGYIDRMREDPSAENACTGHFILNERTTSSHLEELLWSLQRFGTLIAAYFGCERSESFSAPEPTLYSLGDLLRSSIVSESAHKNHVLRNCLAHLVGLFSPLGKDLRIHLRIRYGEVCREQCHAAAERRRSAAPATPSDTATTGAGAAAWRQQSTSRFPRPSPISVPEPASSAVAASVPPLSPADPAPPPPPAAPVPPVDAHPATASPPAPVAPPPVPLLATQAGAGALVLYEAEMSGLRLAGAKRNRGERSPTPPHTDDSEEEADGVAAPLQLTVVPPGPRRPGWQPPDPTVPGR